MDDGIIKGTLGTQIMPRRFPKPLQDKTSYTLADQGEVLDNKRHPWIKHEHRPCQRNDIRYDGMISNPPWSSECPNLLYEKENPAVYIKKKPSPASTHAMTASRSNSTAALPF